MSSLNQSSYQLILRILTGLERPVNEAEFAFFMLNAEQLRDDDRRFTLTSKDFALMNPNTRTCSVFLTRCDAEITREIYEHVPVLINEAMGDEGNPWEIRFLAMLHMALDSLLIISLPISPWRTGFPSSSTLT